MIRVSLPYPPATNNLFVNKRGGGGRCLSKRYAAWKGDAAICIMAARQKPISGRFNAYLVFDVPDNRARDLDGVLKAPLDSLVSAGLIDDDRFARRIVIEWGEPKTKFPMVHITIKEV